jgi:hypothetical protein
MIRLSMETPGFGLVELLVAAAIMLVVTSGVFLLLKPARGMFEAQAEVSDVQQRLRVGVETLRHDLAMAGAGAYVGSNAGSLMTYFAPVLPYRQGASSAYDDGVGQFRGDALTIRYVPSTSAQTSLKDPTDASATVSMNLDPGCPLNDQICGFKVGQTVAVYDGTGAFDTFAVSGTGGPHTLQLQHKQLGPVSKIYPANAKIVEIVERVYFHDDLKKQLMRYNGLSSAVPVLDNVVGLAFDYYGDPALPIVFSPDGNPRTSYGPLPPPSDTAQGSWPQGENCMFQLSGTAHVPRTGLAWLGTAGGGLVRFSPAQLIDGPWCPDDTSDNRYDADLFRIRRIRVTLRVQTGIAALRGSLVAGPDALFAQAGTSQGAERLVPDRSIRFDVSPPNLNFGR